MTAKEESTDESPVGDLMEAPGKPLVGEVSEGEFDQIDISPTPKTPRPATRTRASGTGSSSKRFRLRDVVQGRKSHTPGGFTASDIVVSKHGKVYVSKALSDKAKEEFKRGSPFQRFALAREAVRAHHGFGMIMCGGKTEAGQRFLALARAEYAKMKDAM